MALMALMAYLSAQYRKFTPEVQYTILPVPFQRDSYTLNLAGFITGHGMLARQRTRAHLPSYPHGVTEDIQPYYLEEVLAFQHTIKAQVRSDSASKPRA